VSNDSIAPDPSKIEAVEKMARLRNATKVRTFLGLTNYYRRFMKGYAEMVAPLNALTTKNAKKACHFIWSLKCKLAFIMLKKAMTTAPILAFPNYERPFKLYTNASRIAVGAVLLQWDNEGQERVVAYASCKLKENEANYSVTELEFLSVVVWVQHFHPYLHGVYFKLFTDHQPLKGLIESASSEPKGCRAWWILLLQPYTFNVIYKVGRVHHNANVMLQLVSSGSDGVETINPKALASEGGASAAGGMTSVVATMDRPQWEAAIKGAQKVHAWVTDPYADQAHREAGQEARGAVKTTNDGGAVPSVSTEVVMQEKVEGDVEDANEKASAGGVGHTQTDSSSPTDAPQQVHMDEEVLQQVGCADDDQCHHDHQQTTLNEVGVQCVMEGTDHILQSHGASFPKQQENRKSRDSHKVDDDDLQEMPTEAEQKEIEAVLTH
jgi:hypothetical protein